MQNPLVKKDLVDAILELRADVERQLQANKYYVAMNKLDELLAAIRPLEIIEATVNPTDGAKPEAEAVSAPEPQISEPQAPEPAGEEVRVWTGVVEQQVGDPGRAAAAI
jgi:hypothetical protein